MVVLGGGGCSYERGTPVNPSPEARPFAPDRWETLHSKPQTSFFKLLSSLELSDAKVYEPYIRARLGTAAHLCEVNPKL